MRNVRILYACPLALRNQSMAWVYRLALALCRSTQHCMMFSASLQLIEQRPSCSLVQFEPGVSGDFCLEKRAFKHSNDSNYCSNHLGSRQLHQVDSLELLKAQLNTCNSIPDELRRRACYYLRILGHRLIQQIHIKKRGINQTLNGNANNLGSLIVPESRCPAIRTGNPGGRQNRADRSNGVHPLSPRLAVIDCEHKYPHSSKHRYSPRNGAVAFDDGQQTITQHRESLQSLNPLSLPVIEPWVHKGEAL